VTEPATFLFADIAGFTALTEAHGDEYALELVSEFCDAIRAELPAASGRHVKTVGDAVMLRIPDPADAVRLGLRIVGKLAGDHGNPGVSVGLHHGPAIERDGDYFGTSVNIAARVTALSTSGEVLVTGTTAALVPDLDGVLFEPRGRHELRNVREPVELFAAVRLGAAGRQRLPVDPVCRMAVDPERGVGRLLHDGTVYHFCSLTCAAAFASEPERFAAH
jgi:adenylate cyclase